MTFTHKCVCRYAFWWIAGRRFSLSVWLFKNPVTFYTGSNRALSPSLSLSSLHHFLLPCSSFTLLSLFALLYPPRPPPLSAPLINPLTAFPGLPPSHQLDTDLCRAVNQTQTADAQVRDRQRERETLLIPHRAYDTPSCRFTPLTPFIFLTVSCLPLFVFV